MHGPSTEGDAPRASLLHRAAWRWHFYAGLIILPFLAWLAITGSLYLFKPEIERWIYADWSLVEPRAPLAPAMLIATVERQTGARLVDYATSANPQESWRAIIERDGERRTAFVDPGTGRLLGETPEGGVMETIKTLHSLSISGPLGNAMIEIVAGWAIILVLTGFILWWPRRATVAIRRGGSRGRWRRIHAWTGASVGMVLLFLAASGLSWSIAWGATMQTVIAKTDSGRPRPPGIKPVDHHAPQAHSNGDDAALPWSMQRAAVPHARHAQDIGPDRATWPCRAASSPPTAFARPPNRAAPI